MKKFNLGSISIDPVAYGSQGSAILGIRDSGKSYTATLLAEKLFESGIPFIAFDPIGVWRFLRIPGTGRGYPVVVAGGQEGDLPLTVSSAPEIVRAAMKNGVSLVIDLFDINLSKADWKRIVTACVRVLLHENSRHGLRHVFIEEAAEFAPQRVGPDQGHVYAEIEKLARMGGNSRLGYTLINQRAEEVNKAVLELCDNLFLHRQKGRNSLTALSKWLDIGNVKESHKIIDTLSTLETGKCWAWMAGTERPILVSVPQKNSMHPDRRIMRGDNNAKIKNAVDVKSFVTGMRESLGKIEEEAVANDPARLKRRIAELESELRKKDGGVTTGDLKAAEQRGKENGFSEGWIAGRQDMIQTVKNFVAGLPVKNTGVEPRPPLVERKPPEAVERKRFAAVERPRPAVVPTDGLPNPQRRVLKALHFWHSVGEPNPTREQVAGVSGYSPGSGGFNNIVGAMRTAGLLSSNGLGTLCLVDISDSYGMGHSEAREMLLSVLSNPHKKIVEAFNGSGKPLSREEVADRSGYSAGSGGFNNLVGKLNTLNILERPAQGMLAMTEWARTVLG